MSKTTLLIIILLQSIIGASQTLTVDITNNRFQIDEDRKLIISQIDNIETYSELSDYDGLILSLASHEYTFETMPTSLSYTNSYTIIKSSTPYRLYFTQLPLISIIHQEEIVDEPKISAEFTYADASQAINSDIGIEIRGGFSQTYPKKTYDLEFWEDESGDENTNVKFGNLRSDDDWILDALYNEPLRLRSYIAHKLWLDMHTLYYQEEEPDAKSGADIMFVEVFLNGSYNGLYQLSEQVDRKQLKLKSNDDDTDIKGELYKGVTWADELLFNDLDSYDNNTRAWGGYELKYPKDVTEWKNLYDFTDFVINSNSSDFKENIWDQFNYENFSDYFIFLNVLQATDNTGKNIYLAKYDKNQPYFYVPWDLDGCFGTIWKGSNSNVYDDVLTNGFYDKVLNSNAQIQNIQLSDKWSVYRATILGTEVLLQSFENIYTNFDQNKIYERESLAFPEFQQDPEDFNYLNSWLQSRLQFLDLYFQEISSVDETNTLGLALYPNPATDIIFINNHANYFGNKISIYDFSGALIKEETIYEKFISVADLNPGSYIFKIDGKSMTIIIN